MICPACENEFREGILHCVDCGVDLIVPQPEEVSDLATVTEDHLAAMFDRPEDLLAFCPHCFQEYDPRMQMCPPCEGVPLTRAAEEDLVQMATENPLAQVVSSSTQDQPSGIKCVKRVDSPAVAAWLCQSMEAMGLPLLVGNDAMDGDDIDSVGLYVADRLVADAEMLLDDDEDDIEDALDTRDARLLAANSWAEMGKLRYAQKLAADVLSDDPDNPAAFLTLGTILIGTGDRANALMALGEVRVLLGDSDFSEAGLLLGALQLSNADGMLSTDRDSVARGMAELSSFVNRFPRRIAARHLILAAALSIGKADVAREQWAAIGEVNEWVSRQGGDLGALGHRVS